MTIFPDASEAFSVTGLNIGVDWNKDNFICWFARVNDKLNKVSTWETSGGALDYSLWKYTNIGAGVTITPLIKETKYGLRVFEVVTDATDSTGINVFKDGGGLFSITTLANKTYTIMMQMRRISGGSGGAVPIRMQIRTTSDGATATNVDASLPTSGAWTSFIGSYSTGGSGGNMNVRIFKNSHAFTATWEVSGIMIFEETSAVASQGYNTGAESDTRDWLGKWATYTKVKVGCRPHARVGDENELTCIVDNDDRLFSQEYTASPLYGKLEPNRYMQVRYGTRTFYTGFLENIKPAPLRFGDRTAELKAMGMKNRLEKALVRLDYSETITTDEPLTQVLTTYDSEIDTSFIEVGDTTLVSYGANNKDEQRKKLSIYEIGSDLAKYCERGWFYINEYNAPTFLNRHFNNGVASSATFDNDFDGIDYVTFAERLINQLSVRYYPRNVASSSTIIWSLDESIIVPAHENYELLCPYSDENSLLCGAKSVVQPSGADYIKTLGSMIVGFTARGQEAEVTFSNSDDIDITVSTFNIRGRVIKVRNPVDLTPKKQSSISKYGIRESNLDLKGISTAQAALDIGRHYIAEFSQERGEMRSLTLKTKDDGTSNATQLALELFDVITISEDQTYHLSTKYQICGYEQTWDSEGYHMTKLLIEPAPEEMYWILGSSELDLTTVLGY